MSEQYLNEDAVLACADLVARCGASDFELGYLHDDVPIERAAWYAVAKFRGARISVDEHQSPTLAATALSERLLRGAMCRCRRPVSLSDSRLGCRWRLVGPRWEPGCDAEPLKVPGERGDLAAMQRAIAQPMNRAARRAARRRSSRG